MSITLNLENKAQIVANVTPAIASAIYTSSKLELNPHKGACVALAMVWSFVEFELNTAYNTVDILVNLEYYLDKVRRLNKSTNLKGSAENVLVVAKELNLVSYSEDDKLITLTDKWNSLVLTKNVTLPCVGALNDDDRLTSYLKNNDKPSLLLKEAIQHLQATEYHVSGDMLNIISQVMAKVKLMPFGPKRVMMLQELDTYGYVMEGCNKMANEPVLTSEYDADARGRLYHVACAGANPQASDLARSVYAHNTENVVSMYSDSTNGTESTFTESYLMFLDELSDCAGKNKFQTKDYLTRVANNPVEFLFQTLVKSLSDSVEDRDNCPSKPFTLVRMALDYMDFQTTGKCDSRLGYGLDARCSGTQYFAILAGDAVMGEATGITTKKKSDTTDPYVMSAKILTNKYGHAFANRSFIKTPYMAVQYGGTEKALLTSKDNIQNLVDAGVREGDMVGVAEDCVKAINEALGKKINNLKEVVQNTLSDILEEKGKAYISYRHTDGQSVFKPAAPKVEVCPSFSIFLGSGEKTMHFGKKDGMWTIQSKVPTAEEYVRTFMVNYIQGLDALVARTVIVHAKRAGLKSFTSIHDCFRTTLQDAPKLKAVIASAYKEVFIDNDQHEHLLNTILKRPSMPKYTNIVTEEILNHADSSYFCA